jgi:uncharacterized protein (TIGR03437 family)
LLLLPLALFGQSSLYFDDSAVDRLRLGNAAFEVVLSKSNGAFLAITDKAAAVSLTPGSTSGCLWTTYATVGTNANTSFSACKYSAGGGNRFTYSWQPASSTLTLNYTPGSGATGYVGATVTIALSTASYFDMIIGLTNQMGGPVNTVDFPDLNFNYSTFTAAYLPYFPPGLRLLPAAIQKEKPVYAVYPSAYNFMDFLAVEGGNTTLAVYTVNPSGSIQPARSGFADNSTAVPGTFFAEHEFKLWTANQGSYTSPTVRVRIGQSIQAGIQAYRSENGISGYPSIQQKLGSRFSRMARSPMVKLDMGSAAGSFAGFINLDSLPSPLLLHPCSYWPPAFDQHYPDFLPPKPVLGTDADFAAWIQSAHARQMYMMPYTNPTWWDPNSPTVVNLPSPLTVPQIAVTDINGNADFENYDPTNNSGFVSSPYVPFVQQRLAELMSQFKTDVPMDFVFNDQIGARPWVIDYNPTEPNPLRYSDGWLAFATQYATQGLMTEDGWDRLASVELGFMGSALTTSTKDSVPWFSTSLGNEHFGVGNWEPYPMLTWLVHDKVLTYTHDLSVGTWANTLDVLTWDLLFGNILAYAPNVDPKWIAWDTQIQRLVAPHYAGAALTSFTMVTPEVRQSRFNDLLVTGNWNTSSVYTLNGYGITARGVIAQTDDGSLLAGTFNGTFHGSPLNSGDHYILEYRDPRYTEVWQPIGADTTLTVDPPLDWQPGQKLQVNAVDQNGNTVQTVSSTITNNLVTFPYAATLKTSAIVRYDILNTASTYPVITNGGSFLHNPVSPGEIVTIFGTGLGPATMAFATADSNGQIETEVAGTQVLFDGYPAPLLYVSDAQTTAIVPYAVGGNGVTEVQVVYNGVASPVVEMQVAPASPGIFAIANQDNTKNGAANPAAAGSVLILYATGEGQTSPAGTDGAVAASAYPKPLLPVSVIIGGKPATPAYAGAAPGFVAGALQVNVPIPAGITGAAVPIQLQVGAYTSAAGVTVNIQ